MVKPLFDVSVEFKGYNRVRNQLRAAAAYFPEVVDPIIEKHTKKQADMLRHKPYPARLPNQKYQRTYNLQRSFRAQRKGTAAWAVINRARDRRGRYYAVWVIKKGMQNRKYHLHRWWTLDDTLAETAPELTKNLSAALEKELDRQ